MRWGREIDYHGSRGYDAGEPKVRLLSAVFAWRAKAARRKSRRHTTPEPSTVTIHDAWREIGLVGSKTGKPLRRPGDCPFPVKTDPSLDRHDWRLLP
jgi:hypothetical protein